MKFHDSMYAKVGLGKVIEEANSAILAEKRALPGPHAAVGSRPRVDDSHLDIGVQRRLAGVDRHERGVQAAHGGLPIYAKSGGSSVIEESAKADMEALRTMGVRSNLRPLFEVSSAKSAEKFAVFASKHDMGANDLKLARPTQKEAFRTADMLKKCGYESVQVKAMQGEGRWVVKDAPGIEPMDADDLKDAGIEYEPDYTEAKKPKPMAPSGPTRSYLKTSRRG